MNYVLMTDDANISLPITESRRLWEHPRFDRQKSVVILVTGWNSDIDDENTAVGEMWAAFMTRHDTNLVVIDTARYVDTLYAWSSFNTMELGRGLAVGLSELINVVAVQRIHLVGHSLGAHICGAAGREFELLTGNLLPRITGLDPAKVRKSCQILVIFFQT